MSVFSAKVPGCFKSICLFLSGFFAVCIFLLCWQADWVAQQLVFHPHKYKPGDRWDAEKDIVFQNIRSEKLVGRYFDYAELSGGGKAGGTLLYCHGNAGRVLLRLPKNTGRNCGHLSKRIFNMRTNEQCS